MVEYVHPTLKALGYPKHLHSEMYTIRRRMPESVTDTLLRLMEREGLEGHVSRLPSDRDYFKLPTHARIEVFGDAGNLPIFVQEEEGETALVKYGDGLIVLHWKVSGVSHWFIIPPGPEPLRQDAEAIRKTDLERAVALFDLADWIELMPLSPAAGPDTE